MEEKEAITRDVADGLAQAGLGTVELAELKERQIDRSEAHNQLLDRIEAIEQRIDRIVAAHEKSKKLKGL